MTRRPKPARPALWAEGRQHPPFDARAFLRASHHFASRDLSTLLARCSVSACQFGGKVMAGRWVIPPHRLGRTGRYLPSHHRVGGAVLIGAEVLRQAGEVVVPPEALPSPPVLGKTPPAPPADIPRPRRPVRKGAETGPERPDEIPGLRALIAEANQAAAPPPQGLPQQTKPAPPASAAPAAPPTAPSKLPLVLTKASAWLLARGLVVLAWPWGAVQAGLAHLNGQDLREI